jgi:3-dehydroquinate dehydratase-2
LKVEKEKFMTNVLIINGPNLNMLGSREPEIYGKETLEELMDKAKAEGEKFGMSVDWMQTNKEDELVSAIQEAREKYQAIIINAAAYTHTSIAIMDALKSFDGAIIEVHLSNVHQREEFRHTSYISPVAKGVICGFGGHGYVMAISALKQEL